jgi:LemA protein
LLDSTKAMCKYEASLLKDITKLRSLKINSENRTKVDEKADSVFARLLAISENYPEIKASESFQTLMHAAEYSEREVGAARRTYNSAVSRFNTSLLS